MAVFEGAGANGQSASGTNLVIVVSTGMADLVQPVLTLKAVNAKYK